VNRDNGILLSDSKQDFRPNFEGTEQGGFQSVSPEVEWEGTHSIESMGLRDGTEQQLLPMK
jgi:hypothetical protein